MTDFSELKNADIATIVLHPNIANRKEAGETKSLNERPVASELQEIVGLASAIDLRVDLSEIINLSKVNAANFFGSGTREKLKSLIEVGSITLAVVNTQLSAIQQRNLERYWQCKVIDRTGLIIEIFGARARTHEGGLQVELAALSFQRSRLVRSWTHLERQRGGGGFLGGPGERQIELDRRQLDNAIIQLQKQLKKVRNTRQLHRNARKRVPYPIVALVGYTNAGKSTLFNKLSGANVMSQDMLFATLDPTMRQIALPSGKTIILSDTVGFISNLPTHLIEAFKSTLEEVQSADLILHVRDISHADSNTQRTDVLSVLSDLDITTHKERFGLIEVLNKIDLLEDKCISNMLSENDQKNVKISAITGRGCTELLKMIDNILSQNERIHLFEVNLSDGAAVAWLHNKGTVKSIKTDDSKTSLEVALSEENANRFFKKFNMY
tara:strand:+ start:1587 stop:2906 length:1320 start_codon:yes stop_codon:yes gene_type:complete